MATRQPSSISVDLDSDDTPESIRLIPVHEKTEDDLEADEQSEIGVRIKNAIAGSAKDDVRISVYRTNQDTRKLQFVDNLPPHLLENGDLRYLRNTYGSGDYELRVVGRRGILARIQAGIADIPKPIITQESGMSTALEKTLSAILESQQRLTDALMHRPDPSAEMAKTLGLMVSMREAMGLNQAPIAPAPSANPTTMLAELVGAIKTLREVSAEVNPPPASDDPLALLPQILSVAQTAMLSKQSQPQPQLQPQSQHQQNDLTYPTINVPQSAQEIVAPLSQENITQSTETGDMTNPMAMMIVKGYILKLCSMANAKESIEKGAQYVYEKIPDDMLEMLELPNWFEMLSEIDPKVLNCKDWFIAVRNKTIEMLESENDDDSTETQS